MQSGTNSQTSKNNIHAMLPKLKSKSTTFSPFKAIGSKLDPTKKRIFRASGNYNGKTIHLFTSKPIRKPNGTATIVIALTASQGTTHLQKAMFNLRGDCFVKMCQFISNQNHAIGSGKYCSKIVEGFKDFYKVKQYPGTANNTPISASNKRGTNFHKYFATAVLTFDNINSDNDADEMIQEVTKGVKSILHDETFFEWYLIGVWINVHYYGKYDDVSSEEMAYEFKEISDNNHHDMRKYFISNQESAYLKLIAEDNDHVLEKISQINYVHTPNAVLDELFIDEDILKIGPKFYGTYENKFLPFVIANQNEHNDDFLYYH